VKEYKKEEGKRRKMKKKLRSINSRIRKGTLEMKQEMEKSHHMDE
jgi:hypothetical protein